MEALEGRQLLGSGGVFQLGFHHLPDGDRHLRCEDERGRHAQCHNGHNLAQVRACAARTPLPSHMCSTANLAAVEQSSVTSASSAENVIGAVLTRTTAAIFLPGSGPAPSMAWCICDCCHSVGFPRHRNTRAGAHAYMYRHAPSAGPTTASDPRKLQGLACRQRRE